MVIFFVVDHSGYDVIHIDIVHELFPEWKTRSEKEYWVNAQNEFIGWTRAGGSDEFYLAESYGFTISSKWINRHIKKLSKTNPKFKFFNKNIKYEFKQEALIDERPLKGASLDLYRFKP